jgi:hypothetical protein
MTQMLGWGLDASGGSDNSSASYAMKGAITNALGNAASNIGFQESVYLGHRSHKTVKAPAQKAPVQKAAAPAPAGCCSAPASKPAPAKAKPAPAPAAPAAIANTGGATGTRSKRSRDRAACGPGGGRFHHPARAAQGPEAGGTAADHDPVVRGTDDDRRGCPEGSLEEGSPGHPRPFAATATNRSPLRHSNLGEPASGSELLQGDNSSP